MNRAGEFGTESIEGRFCDKKINVGAVIQQEMYAVCRETEEKLSKMTLESDDQVGLEMLHMFMLDLLGRNSCAAKIFMMKADEEYVLADFSYAIIFVQF